MTTQRASDGGNLLPMGGEEYAEYCMWKNSKTKPLQLAAL